MEEEKKEISVNIRSERFKNNLYALINNSNLPISNVYFIFKLTMQELENLYYGTLNDESKETIIHNEDADQIPEAQISKEELPKEVEIKNEIKE